MCSPSRTADRRIPTRSGSASNCLAAAAGLSWITFHGLRHSYATGALKAGISPKVVSQRIGHANVGFFLQTYAHVLGNDDRDAAERAAAFLLGDPETVANVNQDD